MKNIKYGRIVNPKPQIIYCRVGQVFKDENYIWFNGDRVRCPFMVRQDRLKTEKTF